MLSNLVTETIMSEFKANDRVVVTRGEHSDKHGKVKGDVIFGFWARKYLIHLDDNVNLEIPEGFLNYENLEPHQISTEIKSLRDEVNKVVSQLPGEMGTELPTHLRLLGEALASKDKIVSSYEYDYVTNNLRKASECGSLTNEWRQGIEITLEKIHWAVKSLP